MNTGSVEECPLECASFWSKITLSWISPLIFLGSKKALEKDDIFLLPEFHSSRVCRKLLLASWKFQLDINAGDLKQSSLIRAIVHSFWFPLALSFMCFVPFIVSSSLQPFFVSAILRYTTGDSPNLFGLTSGFAIVISLTMMTVASNFFYNYSMYNITRCGMYCKSSLLAMIFAKSLRLSSDARAKHTTGQIVTLMSGDVERIWHAVYMLNWMWSSPIFFTIAMVLLISEVGLAAFSALGVILLINVVQYYCSVGVGRARIMLVKYTDERIKITNEMLQGIRMVKVYAWEKPTLQRIRKVRENELKYLFQGHLLKMANTVLSYAGHVIILCMLFICYVQMGGILTIEKLYVCTAILSIVKLPLMLLPLSWGGFFEGIASINRIQQYLLLDEIEEVRPAIQERSEDARIEPDASLNGIELTARSGYVHLNNKDLDSSIPNGSTTAHRDKCIVSITDAYFNWGPTATTDEDGQHLSTLRHVSMSVAQGDFVAIVGSVGSGKSSLLAALLGEMNRLSGSQMLAGKVAYVSQEHWIQNMKLCDNILFNSAANGRRYDAVLNVSQLCEDLLALPNGDKTEIGERGINLSGGQKARVCIARTLFASDIDLFVFDDALASVDVHVGRAIFDEALTGFLCGKARIVVLSSNYHFLPFFSKIVVVSDGTATVCNSYDELKEQFPKYATISDGPSISPDETDVTSSSDKLDGLDGGGKEMELKTNDDNCETVVSESVETVECIYAENSANEQIPSKDEDKVSSLVTKEDRAMGSVQFETYLRYFNASSASNSKWKSVFIYSFVVFLFVFSQGVRVYFDLWVGYWALEDEDDSTSHSTAFYQNGYATLMVIVTVLFFWRSALLTSLCLRSSRSLHDDLICSILSAPINKYFDITPIGRILNRFSQDLDMVDSLLPVFYLQNFQNGVAVLATIIMCCASVPYFIPMLLPIAFLYFSIQATFRKTSRELRRLESISRSPVYSAFSEALQGTAIIRAFQRSDTFIHKFSVLADDNMRNFFCIWISTRWLSLRLDLLGTAILFFVSLLSVIITDQGGSVNPNFLGLALVYALQLTGFLQWTIRDSIETENCMTSVERLLVYSEVESEAAAQCSNDPTSGTWPSSGEIVFRNLKLRYRDELDLVLKGVNLTIPGGSKVGICGRSGAGKSSFMLALFRIVEPEIGSEILIDGVDILGIGLQTLRSNLTIIPQDPVMFCGPLRYNLDPFNCYTDAELWEALDRVQLKTDVLEKFPDKLFHELSERGENISVGQRQLICIARALLRKSKIIILDEATAAVDTVTDQKIQSAIRTEFRNCTVLTIAHRLETIADSDLILLMDNGSIGELGTPYELLFSTEHTEAVINRNNTKRWSDTDPKKKKVESFRSMVNALGNYQAREFEMMVKKNLANP